MTISCFQCFLFVVLLSSAWVVHQKMHSYAKISLSSERKYPSCDEVLQIAQPALFASQFLFTSDLSFLDASNINEPPPPFSEDYSSCILCKIRYGTNKNSYYYLGPVNETCILPKKEYVQGIAWRSLKKGSRKEYEWKSCFLPKTFPKLVQIVIEKRWKECVLPKSFPKHVHIPIGGLKDNSVSRERRNLDVCSFPDEIETASLDCHIYPSFVKCTQMCAFGYTLQGGIKQEMKCMKKENVWRPVGFMECQPFVDCTVALTSGGNAKCSYMSLKSPPSCTVSCTPYEDKDEVPANIHTCDIKGKWDPPLPFCAHPGQGLLLATAPKKTLHD